MEYTIYDCWIDGLLFRFRDTVGSNTVSLVVQELLSDEYGLRNITLEKEDTFIDVGANIGIVSIFAKKKFGCKVIAFEPVPENLDSFKYNIELNGFKLSDFEIHEKAVSDRDGKIVKLTKLKDNMGASGIYWQDADIKDEVETITLGRFLAPDVKYLKMDCELSEYDIIPTIKDKLQYLKYIGIEFHRAFYDQYPIYLYYQLRETFKGQMFISCWNFQPEDLTAVLKLEDFKYMNDLKHIQ